MGENKENIRILEDCATISEILGMNSILGDALITIHVTERNLPTILREIERITNVKADPLKDKVSISLGTTEFLFIKS